MAHATDPTQWNRMAALKWRDLKGIEDSMAIRGLIPDSTRIHDICVKCWSLTQRRLGIGACPERAILQVNCAIHGS